MDSYRSSAIGISFPARLLGAVLVVSALVSGCIGEDKPVDRVGPSRARIPVNELLAKPSDGIRSGARLDIGILVNLAHPVVEMTVDLPPGVESVFRIVNPETPFRTVGYRGGGKTRLYLGGGSMPPGTFGQFTLLIRSPEAQAGDTLFFPVELTLADSSTALWNGPPGSARAAPMVVVGGPAPRVRGLAGLLAGGVAFMVLMLSGVVRFRRRCEGR